MKLVCCFLFVLVFVSCSSFKTPLPQENGTDEVKTNNELVDAKAPEESDPLDSRSYGDEVKVTISKLNIFEDMPNDRVLLGDTCELLDDAVDVCARDIPNAECDGSECACQSGFVAIGTASCVPIALNLGEPCVINDQCAGITEFAECYEGVCLCEPFAHVAHLTIGTVEERAAGIEVPDGPLTVIQSCIEQKKLGESCISNLQCSASVWDSECRDDVCLCNDGYVAIGIDMCVPRETGLGSACSVDVECIGTPNSVCVNGRCDCLPSFVASEELNEVSISEVQGQDSLNVNEFAQCLPLKQLDEKCSVQAQCVTKNSNCHFKCRCDEGFISTQSTPVECIAQVENLGVDSCLDSRQCLVADSECSKFNTCDCRSEFCQVNDVCMAKLNIGDQCKDDCQCADKLASCLQLESSEKTCSCLPSEFVNSAGECERKTLQFSSEVQRVTLPINCNALRNGALVGQVSIDPLSEEDEYTLSISMGDGVSVDTETGNVRVSLTDDQLLNAVIASEIRILVEATSNNDKAINSVIPVIVTLEQQAPEQRMSCSRVIGTSLPGNDIIPVTILPTADDCEASCLRRPTCTHFTWRPNNRCFIKGGLPTSTPRMDDPNVVSGFCVQCFT